MEAKLNKDACIGCGLCTNLCPEVFEMDLDGKAKAKKLEAKNLENAKDAQASCPVGAIEVND